MLGLGLLGSEGKKVWWRVKALLFWKEGRARIERTEILAREGVFDVEITYRLEWDGRVGRSTASLDPDGDWASTMEEARRRQARVPVGARFPAWYAESDPENFNVLAVDGVKFGAVLARIWIPVVVILAGWVLFRWGTKGLPPAPEGPLVD